MLDAENLTEHYRTRITRFQHLMEKLVATDNPLSEEMVEAWIDLLQSTSDVVSVCRSIVESREWRTTALEEIASGSETIGIETVELDNILSQIEVGKWKLELVNTGVILRNESNEIVSFFPLLYYSKPSA